MHRWNKRRSQILALILSFTICHSARAANLGFQPAVSYPVGTAPLGVAIGDFNADGASDLAVINTADGSVSVLLGNGNGSFKAAMNFSARQNCDGIASSDFNGDNKFDLAVLRPGDANAGDIGDVTIFLSNGDGTFHQGQVLSPGKNPSFVAVHDVNADHKPDLIVSNATDNNVALLFGKGDGTFQAPTAYATGSNPTSILLVDFDQDGQQDLAVDLSYMGTRTDILLANGDGTLRTGPSLTTGVTFSPIVAWADFNQDANIDYLTSGCDLIGKCKVAVALGNGDGTFQNPRSTSSSRLQRIFVADYDGDGKLDLAGAPSPIKGQIDVLLGNGDGTFKPPASFTIDPNLGVGLAIAGDLNRDTAPDLVSLNCCDKTISVLLNNGTDFSISASKPTPGNVSRGQSATSTVTVALLNGFDNPISLACSVQPTGPGAPACLFNASSISPQPNGSATATLTLNSTSAATVGFMRSAWLLAPILGLVGFGASSGWRKRKLTRSVTLAVLFGGLLLEMACGGGSNGGPRAQSYTVTITGSSIFNQHSTSVTLGVQ
jgi:hypothetical protein